MNNKLKDLCSYVIVIGITLFLATQVLFHYQVNGSSMYPTLEENDTGFALRTNLSLKKINRFDIVIINYVDRYLVKRVIGLPNEKIEYKDNKLYVNGEYVEENFIKDTLTEDLQINLGDNEYYCLGDNRQFSVDSRVHGPFTKDMIRAIFLRSVK